MAKLETKAQGSIVPDPTELRVHPRYPFSSDAEVVDIQGNTRITGRITDIAKKGCYVDTISPFAPKALLALKVTRGTESFETKATVVYTHVGMGMGLCFTITGPQEMLMLETWLSELSGETQPSPNHFGSTHQVDAFEFVDQQSRDVLKDLVLLLSRSGTLTESEGNSLIQRLLK